jgi:hypothetical protein
MDEFDFDGVLDGLDTLEDGFDPDEEMALESAA